MSCTVEPQAPLLNYIYTTEWGAGEGEGEGGCFASPSVRLRFLLRHHLSDRFYCDSAMLLDTCMTTPLAQFVLRGIFLFFPQVIDNRRPGDKSSIKDQMILRSRLQDYVFILSGLLKHVMSYSLVTYDNLYNKLYDELQTALL